MRKNASILAILTVFTLMCAPAFADPMRVIDRVKSFGLWGAGVGIENAIGPNGMPVAMKYAFVSTEIAHPQAGPIHLEIGLLPDGITNMIIITPNLSGQYFAPIGAIDATLIVGNHRARLIGQAASQVTHIYYMIANFPKDFFKWAKNVPAFQIQFPLGALPVSTDGLNQAAAYAMKLRKGL